MKNFFFFFKQCRARA